jgi:hypothetical protein
MRPDELIASYVADVAEQLPMRMRNDVALELRSLLREELQARSEAAERAPDEALTLETLHAFGHPREVAARYHSRWTIIDPGDTRTFVLAAIIGGALLVAASVPAALLQPQQPQDPRASLLGWLGVLVLFFGIKSWALHRHPGKRAWKPHPVDVHQPGRLSSLALVLLICVGIAAYGAPQWLFAQLSGGGQLPHWLDYDPAFRAARLPWLFAAWAAQGVLFLVAAIRGAWTSLMCRLNLGFSLVLLAVLIWFALPGRLFVEPVPDATAHAILWAWVVVLLLDVAMKIYREVGRVRTPDLSAPRVKA